MFYSNLISLLLLPLLAILVSLLIGTWFSWLFWLLWFLWPFCLFPSSFPFWQITVVRPPILPISISPLSWQSCWSSPFWKKMGKNYLQWNVYLLLARKSYSNSKLQEIKRTCGKACDFFYLEAKCYLILGAFILKSLNFLG